MTLPKIVTELPKAPKDTEEWIRKDVFSSRYIIFNSKTRIGTCTLCGDTRELIDESAKHNSSSWCPKCRSSGKHKDQRYGRKNLTERARVLIFGKRGKSVYAGLSEVIMDCSTVRPTIYSDIEAVYKFNSQIQENQIQSSSWYGSTYWTSKKEIKIPYRDGMWGNSQTALMMYKGNIKDVFKGTDLKYKNLENQIELSIYEYANCELFLKLVALNAKYESIELLHKVGLNYLILNKLQSVPHSQAVNWKAKDLRKILKLNRAEIKEAIKYDIKLDVLDVYKKARNKGINIPIEIACEIGSDQAYKLTEASQSKDIVKLISYLKKQQKKDSFSRVLSDYTDYISQCKKLEFNLTDKGVIYPRNLEKAHTDASIQLKVKSSEIENKQIKEQAEKVEKYNYKSGSLLIRVATSAEEIITEGVIQKHCVGTYIWKITSGISSIMFIRKASNPNKPFYTLELNNKTLDVIQCRGKLNISTTEEVKAFIEKWQEQIKKPEKKSKRINKSQKQDLIAV